MKKNFAKISGPGGSKLKATVKFASFLLTRPGLKLIRKATKKGFQKLGLHNEATMSYEQWIKAQLDPATLKQDYDNTYPALNNKPEINIIIQANDEEISYLEAAIHSVIDQSYEHWKLCVANDSPSLELKTLIERLSENDTRIKIVDNGDDPERTKHFGDFLLFMDQGDLLTPNCLFEFVKHINIHSSDQLIYADEDTVSDARTFSSPYFKPDWAPDSLLSRNYIGHTFMVSYALAIELGAFNISYDLLLRASERASGTGHIPKVLYHTRISDKLSTKKQINALEEALARRQIKGTPVEMPAAPGNFYISYEITTPAKISIIIPTKDQIALLKTAIDSIFSKTSYPDFEVIVLNNNSTSDAFTVLMKEYTEKYSGKFRCIDASFPFNFSKLMNLGAAESKGEYLLMCNNDIEVTQSDWVTHMLGYAQQQNAGAVGVKLLYPDNTIQHAGIALGGTEDATQHIFVNADKHNSGYPNYINTVNNYSAITAACLMCSKLHYNEVGGMDEHLPVEYNDVDLCLKFMQAGYYNVYLPMVEVYHYESATRGHPFRSKKAWQQHAKDLEIFKSKWQRLIDNDPYYNAALYAMR